MPLLDRTGSAEDRWTRSEGAAIGNIPAAIVPWEVLAAALPLADGLRLEAPNDSALLWAIAKRRLEDGEGVESVVEHLTLEAAQAAPCSRLNLLLCDGETVAASTWEHSLWVRESDDSVTISSEPFGDADGWQALPDRQLVVATARGAKVRPLS